MSTDLVLHGFTNLELAKTQRQIERYADSRDVRDVFEEGMRHKVAAEIQALKTITAVELAREVHKRAQDEAFKFTREVNDRLQKDSTGQDHNGHYSSLANDLLVMHGEHIKGIVQVGVTNIARETAKDVDVPRKKKGLFQW